MSSPEILSKLNIGSGLNNTDIISSIVEAETVSEQETIDKNTNEYTNKISAYGLLKSDVSAFRTAVRSIKNASPTSHSGSSSSIATATFTTTGVTSNDDIDATLVVGTLAAAHSLVTGNASATSATVGAGSLVIDAGTWSTSSAANDTFSANSAISSFTINTTSSTTLAQLRDSINNATDDVNATILYNGSSYQLVLKASQGASKAIRVTPSGSSSDALKDAYSYTTSTKNLTQSVAASDAAFTVDGISMTRSSNTVIDLYLGYTLELNATNSSAVTLSSTLNLSSIEKLTEDYVTAYNALYENITTMSDSGYNSLDTMGPLAGDSLVNRLQRTLREYSNTSIEGYEGGPYSLALLGIMTNRDGTLSLNKTTFKNTYQANSNIINAVFKNGLSTDSSSVIVSALGTETVPGSYAIAASGSDFTLGGVTMTNSGTTYTVPSGPAKGMVMTISDSNLSSANVYYGESLMHKVEDSLAIILKYNGDIATRVTTLTSHLRKMPDRQQELDARIEKLTARYSMQYANMESAVAGLKDTGDYLSEMLKSGND